MSVSYPIQDGAGAGTVTSVSVTTANGVSGTVANPTSTPAISLTLGAVTPTSVSTALIKPPTDSTNALNIKSASGTAQVSFDTTNNRTYFGPLTDASFTYPTYGGIMATSNTTTPDAANLVLASTSGNTNGAELYFASNINVAAKTGLFQLDSTGNMVFRQAQGTMFFDWFTGLTFRNAASGFATVATVGATGINTPVSMAVKTTAGMVSQLPASPVEGMRASVTDSNAVSFTAGIGSIVAGSGTTHVPVYYDGTNWRIG